MRPFLLTFTLTAAAAAAFWWHQQSVIAGLRADLAAASHSAPASGPDTSSASKPSQKLKKSAQATLLRRPDGSPVVTSRNPIRSALEAVAYVRTLDRDALLALIRSNPPDKKGFRPEPNHPGDIGALLAAWSRLGELDPKATLAEAGTTTGEGFAVVLHDWLIRDRAAALAWFRKQPDSEQKASFMAIASFVLAGSDPALVGELSGTIQDPDLHHKSLTQSIVGQSVTDPDAAIARFGELPDPASRAEVLNNLAMLYGNSRPRALLELALPMASESSVGYGLMSPLLRQDSLKNPENTLDWIAGRPPGDIAQLRKHSRDFPLEAISKLEPAALRTAVSRFESTEDRNWLMANYYAGRGRTAPATALDALATSVSDPALRDESAAFILKSAAQSGREADVEPWLAARPKAEQATLRLQIATWKATAAQSQPLSSPAPLAAPPTRPD